MNIFGQITVMDNAASTKPWAVAVILTRRANVSKQISAVLAAATAQHCMETGFDVWRKLPGHNLIM